MPDTNKPFIGKPLESTRLPLRLKVERRDPESERTFDTGRTLRVLLNGHEIHDYYRLVINISSKPATVELHFFPQSIEIDADVLAELTKESPFIPVEHEGRQYHDITPATQVRQRLTTVPPFITESADEH